MIRRIYSVMLPVIASLILLGSFISAASASETSIEAQQGGTNLVTNGNFDTSAANWSLLGSGNPFYENGYVNMPQNSGDDSELEQTNIVVIDDGVYELSIDCYTSGLSEYVVTISSTDIEVISFVHTNRCTEDVWSTYTRELALIPGTYTVNIFKKGFL